VCVCVSMPKQNMYNAWLCKDSS